MITPFFNLRIQKLRECTNFLDVAEPEGDGTGFKLSSSHYQGWAFPTASCFGQSVAPEEGWTLMCQWYTESHVKLPAHKQKLMMITKSSQGEGGW